VTDPTESYRTPYARTPGGSTPGPEVTPAEGKAELWAFFWAAVLSVVIITVGGLAAYFYVHP
jgi:hypothetical protein